MAQRILLTIAYLGTGFHGWQRQPDRRTVQQSLEDALSRLYCAPVTAVASGRTDEGVHALGQTVHFDAPRAVREERIVGALNSFLPQEIRVLSACQVATDFNARKSAHKKTYEYRFYFSQVDNPFLYRRALRVSEPLDLAAMAAAAPLFEGTHDFAAFRCLGSSAKTTVRTVYDCRLQAPQQDGRFPSLRETDAINPPCAALSDRPAQCCTLTITANGFLYKMVRLITGALIQVGLGKLTAAQIEYMLATGESLWQKKPSAPEGLYLLRVEY